MKLIKLSHMLYFAANHFENSGTKWIEEALNMAIPAYLESTYTLLFRAFPEGIDEESYWALLYLLYDHMADENLVLVMSSLTGKSWGVTANDIYKVPQLKIDDNIVHEVKYRLKTQNFEKWINEIENPQ